MNLSKNGGHPIRGQGSTTVDIARTTHLLLFGGRRDSNIIIAQQHSIYRLFKNRLLIFNHGPHLLEIMADASSEENIDHNS